MERRDRAYGQADSINRAVQEVIADLAQARERLEHWNLQRQGWGGIRVGVQRIYARGRRDFAGAYALPSDEAFHDWRKQVKYLWYHTQILENIWPSVMRSPGCGTGPARGVAGSGSRPSGIAHYGSG